MYKDSRREYCPHKHINVYKDDNCLMSGIYKVIFFKKIIKNNPLQVGLKQLDKKCLTGLYL